MMRNTMTEHAAGTDDAAPYKSSLPQVLDALNLSPGAVIEGATVFTGAQFDAPFHHILGGHIAAQALVAAGRTVGPERTPHSLHGYFLRAGDARYPVEFEVVDLQQGRNFSARQVTARQSGAVLMAGVASFCIEAADGPEYHPEVLGIPDPEKLSSQPHPAQLAGAGGGSWTSLQWFQRRPVEAGARDPGHLLTWWRPDGPAGDDSLTAAALVVYLSAASLVESAVAARAAHRSRADNTAQRDIAVWFHRPARLADWLLLDQRSDSAVGARALALGRVYNRDGELVATAGQEQYFPPVPPRRV
jgi:acyl-CoA thioesterase II